MRQSGCIAIGYGIESGSQVILDSMNKGISVEQQKKAIRATVRAGIMPIIQLMYGYPGETQKTLKDTIRLFREIPYIGYIGILIASNLAPTTPLPGTELYEQAIKKGLIEKEEEFLENLSAGYMFDGIRPLVKFTEFNNSEYEQIRIQTQRRIFSTHLKRHILPFAKEYILRSFRPALVIIKKNGWFYVLKKTAKTLLILLSQIFFSTRIGLINKDFHEEDKNS